MRAQKQPEQSGRAGAARPARTVRRPAATAGPQAVLALQRLAGNGAVSRTLRVQRERAAAEQDQHEHGAGCGHDQPVQREAAQVQAVTRKPGSPVDPKIRGKAEKALGTTFRRVEVHRGADAQASAAAMGARAYTTTDRGRQHIVLGAGADNPHTLYHELTHADQQAKGPVEGTDTGGGISLSSPGDKDERAAEAKADEIERMPDEPEHAQDHAQG
ncbi:DUF4157 domain-containing protein [Streptomyces xiamenensis]|uniref:eCIS core domain-containing protein n=1 Tax=Streptomyces xiamenensis TaxID=408015 RepID=UPI00341FB1C6